jgi:hypothetical protein
MMDYALCYQGKDLHLVGYSDADWDMHLCSVMEQLLGVAKATLYNFIYYGGRVYSMLSCSTIGGLVEAILTTFECGHNN